MKILVTSASHKVPLIECIKKTTKLEIVVGDISEEIITKFFSMDYLKMQPLNNFEINSFITSLKEKNIKYLLPTRDEDVLFFSRYKSVFLEKDIYVFCADIESIKIANDKLLFHNSLSKEKSPVIKTYNNLLFNNESANYIIKERFGSGSKKIKLNVTYEELKNFVREFDNPIIQPMINGTEFSIDLFISKEKRIISTVVRKRSLVIDGESQITEITNRPDIENIVKKAACTLQLTGHIMFQVIEDTLGKVWLLECNPRIGGASTLSIYAGLDSFNWWIAEALGKKIDVEDIEIKQLKQIRYKKDLII